MQIDKLRFTDGQTVSAKIRYKAMESLCKITYESGDTLRCDFPEAVRAITPGQAVVFYEGDIVLGGGTIIRG